MKLKAEDIVFFIVIGLIIFVAIWLLRGSPTLVGAIVSVAIFAATSDILLWRKLFEVDKNTSNGFNKVKHDFEIVRNDMKYFRREMKIELDNIKEKLDKIENLIKNRI